MASAQDLISTVYPDTIAEVGRLSAIDDPDAEPFKSKYAAAALLEELDGQLLPLLVRPGRRCPPPHRHASYDLADSVCPEALSSNACEPSFLEWNAHSISYGVGSSFWPCLQEASDGADSHKLLPIHHEQRAALLDVRADVTRRRGAIAVGKCPRRSPCSSTLRRRGCWSLDCGDVGVP
jgi:hypothetical protein